MVLLGVGLLFVVTSFDMKIIVIKFLFIINSCSALQKDSLLMQFKLDSRVIGIMNSEHS